MYKNLNSSLTIEHILNKANDNECEWDIIRNIVRKAIERSGFTQEQVRNNSKKFLKEVRYEKSVN